MYFLFFWLDFVTTCIFCMKWHWRKSASVFQSSYFRAQTYMRIWCSRMLCTVIDIWGWVWYLTQTVHFVSAGLTDLTEWDICIEVRRLHDSSVWLLLYLLCSVYIKQSECCYLYRWLSACNMFHCLPLDILKISTVLNDMDDLKAIQKC
jgi:hypothetical protein